MRLALVLGLLQQPAMPPAFPNTQIEITAATAAVEVGQKIQLAARALDASGQPVPVPWPIGSWRALTGAWLLTGSPTWRTGTTSSSCSTSGTG